MSLERVGGEAVLHDPQGGQAHVVNASAARLWELCDGTRDRERLVADFAALYGIGPDQVRADVQALLAHFRSLNLLA